MGERGDDGLVVRVDGDALARRGADERYTQRLVRGGRPISSCSVSYIVTPPGGGSPEGLHTHDVDQVFYVLDGTMTVEIAGDVHEAGAGTLVVFPAGVPHRNWNAGATPTTHLGMRMLQAGAASASGA